MFTTLKKSQRNDRLSFEMSFIPKGQNYKIEDKLTGKVLLLCLSTFFFGYALAYFSTLSTQIKIQQYSREMAMESVFGPCLALIPLGAAVGVVIAYFFMNMFSRKAYLGVLNVANLVITAFLQISSIEVVFIFRILQGVLVGNYMTLIPTYINELSSKEIAARYSVFPQISVVLGVLTAYTLGVIYDVTQLNGTTLWRLQMGFPVLPVAIQSYFLLTNYIPESPNYLILKNKREQARDILGLFVVSSYVENIIEEKTIEIQSSRNVPEEQKITVSRKAFQLGCQLSIYQCFCGIASMVTQAGHVISHFDKVVGRYTPIFITIMQLLGTFISIPMLRNYEWKHITLVGGYILALCDLSLALLFLFYDPKNQLDFTMVFSMIVISIFMFTFGVTFGSSVWPYISNLIPRKRSIQAALVLNWVGAGLTIMALSFTDNVISPPYPIFFFYAIYTLIFSVINNFVMVPVKGKNYREIQKILE